MKPVETKESNARLILPEEEGLPEDQRRGDLPIERCAFIDPETEEQHPGFESTWLPDDGERKALANGAPVMVRLWGTAHPPLKVVVGEPDEESMQRLVTVKEAKAASSRFFEALSKRMAEGDVDVEEIPKLFDECLREELASSRPKPRCSSNGKGPEH